MITSRDLLELISEYVAERGGGAGQEQLQSVAQRFDVALGEYIVEYASVQNEA